VELGERSYQVEIGAGNISAAAAHVNNKNKNARVAIVTDEVVESIYGEKMVNAFEERNITAGTVVIPVGEESKNVETLAMLWDSFAELGIDRKSVVVALGGGVVGDVTGFAAGTYLRGVDYLQVPTTILAQVDSSVGGKVAINLHAGKNLAGLFYQPRSVVIDVLTLKTLPEREVRAGLAEVVKYGVIWDESFMGYLEDNAAKILAIDPEVISHVVMRSVQIKAEVVGSDETEQGLRRILNYGHTLGHSLENLAGYGVYLHGEAVAWGMAVATRISAEMGMLKYSDADRVLELLKKLSNVPKPADIDADELIAGTRKDKKAQAGKVNYVLAESVGRVVVRDDVDEGLVKRVVEEHIERG